MPAGVKVSHNGVDYTCVAPPNKLKYVERTEFLQSLFGSLPVESRPLESVITSLAAVLEAPAARVTVDRETVYLATTYIRLKEKGARLPKFSRWATGLFKDDKTLAKDLATAGKVEDTTADIVISGNIMDILRNADTPHFYSCLKAGGPYEDVTKGIVEKCPGIAIAYIDDENGKMRGRCWVHHAERVDNGATVAVVCQKWGGTLDAVQVVKALRARGVEAYCGGSYGKQARGGIPVNFVGCFTEVIHHDMYTWIKGFKVDPT